MSSESGPSPVP